MAKKKAAPKTEDTQKMDTQSAAEILRAEQEERRQRCGSKIQEILEQEGCELKPSMTLTPEGVIPRIDIVVVR